MFFQNLFILFCVISVTKGKSWPCPLLESDSPCKCLYEPTVNYDLNFDCSLVATDQELATVLSSPMPFYDFSSLTIIKDGSGVDNLNTFSRGIFGSCLSFKTVEISGTTLSVIGDGTFQNSEPTLEYFLLSGNQISTFIFPLLQNFKSLVEVDLSLNKIRTVPPLSSKTITYIDLSFNAPLNITATTFSGVSNLQHLNLSGNALTEAPANLFIGLTLQEILYHDNNIKVLKLNAITSANSSIENLDFSNNEIGEVEIGAIDGLSDTAQLNFANNLIDNLYAAVWRPIFETVALNNILDFSSNPLICGCEFAWLFAGDPTTSLINKVTDSTTCYGGAPIKELDPNVFISMGC